MKSTRQIFINILFASFVISFLSTCVKKDSGPIQNNWETIYQNNDLYLYSIKFLDKDHGFVMADSDCIHGPSNWKYVLTTSDGGKNWNMVNCTTYDTVEWLPLYDIGFIYPISQNVLLTTGYRVHKSIDGGRTWIDLSPQFIGSTINDLHVIDSITWIVAAGLNIYRTDNGGQSWETVFHTDSDLVFSRLSFPTKEVGYASIGRTDPDHFLTIGHILKTFDGGQSWHFLNSEPWKSSNIEMPDIYSLQFLSDLFGYIKTYDYKLYRTIDGGNNWNLVNDNIKTNGLQYFITQNAGYCSDGVTIYVTNDGGKAWKADYYNNAAESDILAWTFLETGEGYALTRDHRIIKNNF